MSTEPRAYKKNDQAYVEEKNGSIVRKLIGYDRYEGVDVYNALSELYVSLRLYVNFFQPSLKLISKKRDGVKVTKKYDKAKTPYQRLLCSSHIPEEAKTKLKAQYEDLGPVALLKDLEKLQDNFWQHAWKPSVKDSTAGSSEEINLLTKPIDSMPTDVCNIGYDKDNKVKTQFIEKATIELNIEKQNVENNIVTVQQEDNNKVLKTDYTSQVNIRFYRRTNKPRKQLGLRTWRTRPDHFENVWDKIRMQLELNPACTAKSLLEDLIKENPDQFNINHSRTLQRRVAEWRKEQIEINQK